MNPNTAVRTTAEPTRRGFLAHQALSTSVNPHKSQAAQPRCSSRTSQVAIVDIAIGPTNPLTAAGNRQPKKRQQRPRGHTGQTAVVLLRSAEPDHISSSPPTGGPRQVALH